MHRVGFRQQLGHHRMSGFMIGGIAPFTFRHHNGATFRAHENLVLGALEVVHIHKTLIAACRKQRCLIHQIGEIRARHSRVCLAR